MRLDPSTRVALVAEELSDLPDEGVLRFLERLTRHLVARCDTAAFHGRGRAPAGVVARKLRFTRFGVSPPLAQALRGFAPELVFYAPSASLTANALWRATVLRRIVGVPVVVLGLQPRRHGPLGRLALRFLRPDAVVVTSAPMAVPFRDLGWTVIQVRAGVDTERFRPLDPADRQRLRQQHGWVDDRPVLLHVGHLRARRGLQVLEQLAAAGSYRVVMVASASERGEEHLAGPLRAAGVELHHEFVPDVQRFYQAADLYVFPVDDARSAIDFPLSVLEALACGIPVVTTRHGALPEHFDGTGALRFVADRAEFPSAVTGTLGAGSGARSLAEPFGWERCFDDLFDQVQERLS